MLEKSTGAVIETHSVDVRRGARFDADYLRDHPITIRDSGMSELVDKEARRSVRHLPQRRPGGATRPKLLVHVERANLLYYPYQAALDRHGDGLCPARDVELA
jgi:hypothetical protein